jgi:hypothetical protein
MAKASEMNYGIITVLDLAREGKNQYVGEDHFNF